VSGEDVISGPKKRLRRWLQKVKKYEAEDEKHKNMVEAKNVEDMLKELQSVSNTSIAKIDQGAGRLHDEVPLFVGSETAPAIGKIN